MSIDPTASPAFTSSPGPVYLRSLNPGSFRLNRSCETHSTYLFPSMVTPGKFRAPLHTGLTQQIVEPIATRT